MRVAIGVVAAAVLAMVAVAESSDHCNAFLSCATCVASPFCGWCSTPVVYQNGAPGFQCAGFNDNQSNPFVCNGIYSTITCTSGYACNTSTYQCELTTPGSGVPLEECQSNCSTIGKTFICNNATHTCEIAPAGQGTSFEDCEQSCSPQSHSPSSSSPASSSPASSSPASGSPSSGSPASSSPQPTSAPTYMCNTSTAQCVAAPPGQGSSLIVCQQQCKQSNNTPSTLLGLWRSFPIDSTTPVNEYDLWFHMNNTVSIFTPTFTSLCDVSNIGNNVWFTNCAAPEPPLLKCLYEITMAMPETYHAMIACNYAGGNAPTDFNTALGQSNVSVMFMSKCVPDGYCKFHAGPSNSSFKKVSHRGAEAQSVVAAVQQPTIDPCSAFAANCSYCLSHELCGWCSANVIYTNGQTGSQCAGFNSNPNATNPFTCTGTYSTEMCLPGWVCEPVNQTCEPTTPGSGVPQQDCETSCKAQPGPPSLLIGSWRGLVISNGYPYGVLEVVINQTTIVGKFQGQMLFTGTMKNLGGDVFITYTDGPNVGATLAGIYTNDQNEVVEYVELAFGGDNTNAPSDYKQGMLPPNSESVLVKCASSNCHF